MQIKPSSTAVMAAAVLLSTAMAVTPISDSDMSNYLAAGGAKLAYLYAPIWFFGQALNEPPCYPDWAFGGSPTSPDIYDTAHQTPAAPQCQYPDVGCNCRNPGVALSNPGPPFPIYYSFEQCNSSEVRVAYNLFYQKDGAEFGLIQTGHI